MVLPLIPIAIGAASLISGALGLKKGFDAKKTLAEAREIGKNAQRRYDSSVKELEEKRERVNQELTNLGVYKTETFKQTLGYVVEQVKNARSSVEGIEERISSIDIREVEVLDKELTQISALEFSSGSLQGITAGAAGAFGAYGTVGLIASASTGTAISSLSGAAATNATLAWLGGGSLASGGLGVAGGTLALGGLVAGPALAIAGYVLASKAEEALTTAEEYKADVGKAIAELEAPKLLLGAIQSNIDDTRYVLIELVRRFAEVKLDFEHHLLRENGWRRWYTKIRGSTYQKKIVEIKLEKLEKLIIFGKTIKAVISEPLLDANGAATSGFHNHITGIVNTKSIDAKDRSCVICGVKISVLDRVCNECNAIQSIQHDIDEINTPVKIKKSLITSLAMSAGVLVISLILALFYWQSTTKVDNQKVVEQKLIVHPSIQIEQAVRPPIQVKQPLIDIIFQTKTLGMSSQYFETLVGPAKYIESDNSARVYEIDGCEVKTIFNNEEQKSIQALNIKITSTCNAILGDFISSETKNIRLQSLTFNKLEQVLAGSTHPITHNS